eukprot:g1043.t1
MIACLVSATIPSHGMMKMPVSWQAGNYHPDLLTSCCASGGCNWFTNDTRLPVGVSPTIPQDSPLRTFADPDAADWTARNPWRSPGRARTYSPCGSEGGNPNGCIQADGTLGPCVIDDGAFAFGPDGRSLGGLGVVTSWQQGSVVEVGWSLRSNHGGGYSFRLCKRPASGNLLEIDEACFARTPLDFVGNSSVIEYHDGSRFEIDAIRTTNGTYPPGSMWTRNPVPCFGSGQDIQGNGTQFPLPTLHGKPVRTPKPLAGFCPCRSKPHSSKPPWARQPVHAPGSEFCYCCCGCCSPHHASPDFDEWMIVDQLQIPHDLEPGEWVLGFRW